MKLIEAHRRLKYRKNEKWKKKMVNFRQTEAIEQQSYQRQSNSDSHLVKGEFCRGRQMEEARSNSSLRYKYDVQRGTWTRWRNTKKHRVVISPAGSRHRPVSNRAV